MPSHDRWIWIELIGFDNESTDFGVRAYLDNAGFVPDAASLLVYNPDFLHTHDGMAEDRTFPFDFGSYGGHPSSYERERQDWTKYQLRGLVRELQSHGVAVYVSVFDFFVTDEWIGKHPELLHVTRRGERIGSVCPWKRLKDGTYYEDFLARKLSEVLEDYGFDGFHQADGISHPRLPLHEGDFSDDVTGQFVDAAGVILPEGLAEPSGDTPEALEKRAAWIWRHARREWIGFYAERVARFTRKLADAAHAQSKKVIPNNALTRDPFEALYRFGVDYRRMADAGADGYIVETVAPGVALGAEDGREAAPHYDYLAMLLLLKARVPDLDLRCLNSAHDVNEQWDALRHGPVLVERDVYCNANLYRWRHDGRLERCSAGRVVCLADGLQPHEWQWLREWWERAYSATPQRVIGATVVCSDAAFEGQLDDFLRTRRWTTHKLLHELMARGAPLYCVADVKDLGGVTGPLLVPNPQCFPEEELREILEYRGGPIVTIGGPPVGPRAPDLAFEDCYPPEALVCCVYGSHASRLFGIEPDCPEDIPEDLMGIEEPRYFVNELYFRKVSESFLRTCAQVLAECSGAVKVLRRAEVIRVQAMELSHGLLRLLVGNDSHFYVVTELEVGHEIEGIEVVTPFPGTAPTPQGRRFGCRVPGKGMVIFDVRLRAP